MEGSKHLLIRGKSKNEKVKEDNIEEKLNNAEFVADFEKELIDLDYARYIHITRNGSKTSPSSCAKGNQDSFDMCL
ncbi:uncharacterized protein EAE98_010193 [Botrytis deweyae]|uniref:Uncharacterized protein n=1 Tax=Botrytis deweyae TaxID=2478750 RepID=A0ABQ7I9D1_9HELO|nr:uncharacterized protein EAE98_010193 [Botrytis deweyae]KAF7917430.1 hypothetical protein EAE98_010193 [Botrytis deweyae]